MSKKGLSLLGLLFIVIGLIGCLYTFKNMMTQSVAVSQKKIINEPFSNVQVNTDNTEVEILPTTDSQATVQLSGNRSNKRNVQLNTAINGNTLQITLKNRQMNVFNFNFINQSLKLTVYLPKNQYERLQVSNNNGIVRINKISSNNLNVITHNGLINLTDTSSKNVDIQSHNGKLSLTHVEGNLTGTTNNGVIKLVTHDLDRSINLQCHNGKIDIQTEKEPTNTRFQAHVDNGTINILNKYKGDAVIGKGEHLVELSTNNGSIMVENK